MKFTLPISPSYVNHWGLWEAVREVYQNALDENTLDPDNIASMVHYAAVDTLVIKTTKGLLIPSSLVLGNTSKAGDSSQRGKFGEGYKLALLVLARMELPIEILNGPNVWFPRIEYDETFGSSVLNIYVDETMGDPSHEGVEFVIHEIDAAQFSTIQRNITPCESRNTILLSDSEKGRVYVGGLFVGTMKEFQRGYSFLPGAIGVDRDRCMINGFDLSYESSRLHMDCRDTGTLQLLEREAPDVAYVHPQAMSTSPIVLAQSREYFTRHGYKSVPVSTQEEIKAASDAGLPWTLVKSQVKALLGMVHSWFIPSTKPPVTRLREFRDKYQYELKRSMIDELNQIIEQMQPTPKTENIEVTQ